MNVFFRPLALFLLLSLGPAVHAETGGDAADLAEARQYVENDQPREALAIYKSLVEDNPDNAVYLTELGRTQLSLKRALDATWSLQDAIAADPEQEEAYRLLVQAYLASGQSERAYDTLQEARKQFGERPWMEQL